LFRQNRGAEAKDLGDRRGGAKEAAQVFFRWRIGRAFFGQKKRNFEKTPSQETFCKKQSGSNNVAASCSQICFHYVSLVLFSCVGFVFLKKEKRNRRKEISKERFHKNPLQETKWQQQSDSIVFTNCFRLASLSCSPVLFFITSISYMPL
jgi:hypothetical protein